MTAEGVGDEGKEGGKDTGMAGVTDGRREEWEIGWDEGGREGGKEGGRIKDWCFRLPAESGLLRDRRS